MNKRSARRRTGWILVVVAIVLFVGGLAMTAVTLVPGLVQAFNSDVYPTPMDQAIRLGSGDYSIYELTDPGVGFGGTTVNRTTIGPEDVHITGPGGRTVTPHALGHSETLARNDDIFTAAVSFHAPRDGIYQIRIDSDGERDVLVARGLGPLFLHSLAWLGSSVLGFFLLIAGIVLVAVNRQRPALNYTPYPSPYRPLSGPAAGQPGWYPDPGVAGGWRWWTGRDWAP
jgi:hypothetical protein